MSYESEILKGLNPEQAEIVKHLYGPLLAGAVAGSGKTHALIARIAYMVRVHGIDPSRVLSVTFSKKAADEMNDRLKAWLGNSEARIGTFHSLGYEICRKESKTLAGFKVDDQNRFKFVLKDTLGYDEMKWTTADLTFTEQYITRCKAALALPGSDAALAMAKKLCAKVGPQPYASPSKLAEAYSRSDEIRIERQLLTFDDMLVEAWKMLSGDEETRIRWASKYDFVLQDEAQDQNRAQLELAELLARDHKNYMIVGDVAQTIFEWRGADPSKLLSFEKDWGAKVVFMNRNYRCGKTIVEAANKSLSNMDPDQKLDMEMVACRDTDGIVTSTLYTGLDDEGDNVASQVLVSKESGREWKDHVVLYRTNAQSRAIEESMISARIPYRIIGGTNFYERKEVRDLLAYLRLADGRGTEDDVKRCINTPFRYLGKAFVTRMEVAAAKAGTNKDWPSIVNAVADEAGLQRRQRESAEDWGVIVVDIAERIKLAKTEPDAPARGKGGEKTNKQAGFPARILEDLVKETKYQEYLIRDEGQETTENNKVSNVREMIRASERFTSVGDLLDYIEMTIAKSRRQRDDKAPNKVTLMTAHRSKGLEWPVVFVIGCNEAILPHKKADVMDEERRLFYVATTRAMNELHYSCVLDVIIGGQVRAMAPSRFLTEVGYEPRYAEPKIAEAAQGPSFDPDVQEQGMVS